MRLHSLAARHQFRERVRSNRLAEQVSLNFVAAMLARPFCLRIVDDLGEVRFLCAAKRFMSLMGELGRVGGDFFRFAHILRALVFKAQRQGRFQSSLRAVKRKTVVQDRRGEVKEYVAWAPSFMSKQEV